MSAKKKISIDQYEIGRQRNYDLLDFYESIINPDDEPEIKNYHHSLFYPILCYCVDIINKTDDLNKIKFKVGLDENDRIYVTVGREMYDYFFLEKVGNLDNVEIEFNSGKKDFLLSSVHNNDENNINNYKTFYKIKSEDFDGNEFLKKKKAELDELEEKQLKEFIQIKKDVIITKFLKGYSHQESILKIFEGKIKGHILNLPNLIYKKCNKEGKTIEEIDQIYLINLESPTLTIDGFNYFYFAKYLKGVKKEHKIFPNGIGFKIANDNLYFLEIKKSIKGLSSEYKKLKATPISVRHKTIYNKETDSEKSGSKNSFISSLFKRDELTCLGNSFLSFDIFRNLVCKVLGNKERECNLLYIVDSEFKEYMIKIFEQCLERDKKIIEELKLSFNLYLIYTQPDLALKHFIKESWEKKNKISLLEKNLATQKKEIDKQKKEIDNQKKEIDSQNQEIKQLFQNVTKMEMEMKIQKMQYMPYPIDQNIIDFIKKKVSNKNSMLLIGLFEKINDNPTYFYTSLNFFQKKEQKEKITLVDLKTFNKVKLNDLDEINNELFSKYIIDDYKMNINTFHLFDEIYIMVDLIFLKNISLFIDNKILENYDINIHIMTKDTFLMHLKKENFIIQIIKITNEEKENPLFKFGESEVLQLFEIEQFAKNYINLLRLRDFIGKTSDKFLNEEGYLFDFKGRINYILSFCKKVNNNNEGNKNCFIQIASVKELYNILVDKFIEQYIENKNYKNIIFVRKTEFGKSFTKEELISILNYYFNIDKNSECENRITWKDTDNNLIIDKYYLEQTGLIRLIKYKTMLPIFLMNDKKINNNSIQLLEYIYFLLLPILIQQKSKPKVLIISDDYGILNNYYQSIYGKELDILFATEKYESEEIFNKEIILEYNNKMIINSYEEAFKKFNSKNNLFDLIIVEKYFNETNTENTIPTIKNNYSNLLTPNGIFSLNIRSSSVNEQTNGINKLKNRFKNIKIINFRTCSDLLICSKYNAKIQIVENFHMKYPKLLQLSNINYYIGQFFEDIEA